MAFIGNSYQTQGFAPAIDYFNGDGTTVTFTTSRPIASAASIIVTVDNVIQNPGTPAYSVSGNSITFSSAPLAGTNNIWIEYTSLITQTLGLTQDPTIVGDITTTGGFYAVGDFGNAYSDGTVVDYVTGNARFTTGPADGITFYNGGYYSRNPLFAINASGAYGLGPSSSYGTSGQALISQGSGSPPIWGPAGLTIQSVKTSGFTAVSGNIYPCNTTSAAFTVTLPASPTAGDQIAIVDYAGTFATYNLTVSANGLKINASTSNAVLSTSYTSVIIIYLDSTRGWTTLSSSAATPGNPLPTNYTVSYLVQAGGAGGGSGNGGGGGGAGGLLTGTLTLNAGTTYTAVVGAGGSAGPSPTNGSDSSFPGVTTATGGGRGGAGASTPSVSGFGGGCGGGAGRDSPGGPASNYAGGSGTPGQGYAGGSNPSNGGGGGGGTSAVGFNSAGDGAAAPGSCGGAGTASSITGAPANYGGGGGGASYTAPGVPATAIALGGTGGGGRGASRAGSAPAGLAAVAGTANTGGGGGGGGVPAFQSDSAAGGSGVVILSVPTVNYTGITTGSPTITTSGSNTIITWTTAGSGTYKA